MTKLHIFFLPYFYAFRSSYRDDHRDPLWCRLS